ncbi:DUF6923 family protein, partial [Mesorhizobium japonicum]|uniref:DUF6923 family protein n=1 Tax=Mesorhizobium japonicum TaxID=2066070 RepID=UPI003B5BF319
MPPRARSFSDPTRDLSARPSRLVRRVAAASAALLIGALLSAVGLASTRVDRAVAAGQNCTVPSPLLFNTGGGGDRLYSYDPTTGAQESSVPLAQDYGDIAITSAGVLYGASFNSYSLDTIDPATGAVTSTIAIDIPNGQGDLNALSALPNGDLLAGLSYNSTVYDVDPTTGHATVFTT